MSTVLHSLLPYPVEGAGYGLQPQEIQIPGIGIKCTNTYFFLGIIHYFQQYHKSTESTLGGGKSSCMLSKMLVLATVPVCETSLAN